MDETVESWAWSDEWTPQPAEWFKWGWNGEKCEATVWRVVGGVDGFPRHDGRFAEVWGREPNLDCGDRLGVASAPTEAHPEQPLPVRVQAYYAMGVPEDVLVWFRNEFPGRTVEECL